ncbi:MAG TPA: prolyl oligopeptidase family serine peptidase [Vicinamibacterales bacterium]
MRMPLRGRTIALLAGSLLLTQWSLDAQSSTAPAKRPLTYDVVDYWKSIGGTRISDDGQWVLYTVTSQAEDGELIVRNLRTTQEYRHPRGTNGQFTPDGKFVVFTIAQSKAEEEREREQNERRGGEGGEGQSGTQATPPSGEPRPQAAGPGGGRQGRGNQANTRRNEPRTGMGIMSLADGKVVTVDKVGSFRLPDENSTWLAYYKGTGGGGAVGGGRGGRGGRGGGAAAGGRGGQEGANARNRKQPGSDLVVRNLTTGEETTIPEVTEYSWNKGGTLLAYAVSSNDAAKDGAFVRRMSDATVITLHSGKGRYSSLAFDDAGTQITFLSDQAEFDKPVAPYRVYYWRQGAAASTPSAATEIVSADTPGMPKGMVVAQSTGPRFSRDGARIFLATAPPPDPPADSDSDEPDPIPVDLWSTNDPWLQPMQRVRAQQERNRSYRAVYHLNDKKFVQLATPDLPTVSPSDDLTQAIGMSDIPYRKEVSWDQTYNDVYLLDLRTGKPNRILEHWGSGSTSISPGGKYVLYFDEENGHWFTYRVADGVRANLTEKVNVRFQQENDTPSLPGAYGTAGWTANDASVLLYDQFDIWEVKPDGSGARNITGGSGRQTSTVFRYRSMDTDERVVPADKPLLLSATDDRTRATGFYRLASLTATTAPQKVVMVDKAFGAVNKAKNADTVVFTLSRFDEFPDIWTSDLTFKDMKKVSNVGAQMAPFSWGKSELIEYINADGQKLRAILTKPDNFDPNKKYPLMVYIYEELSQGLHSFSSPNVGTSINIPRYVSNGYVLLRPDIVYTTGYPGEAAEKCVIPAVNTVVEMGFIDPKRIGIQGHSWGGYQITHLITRTNMFAAVEAGASVVNMVSAYGGIRWGTGMSRAFQYEKTQSRIGAPPWNAPLQFIENSPIFWVEKVQTPYLTIHNDEDDAVPWYQGIEWITALRRLGKEGYMFNYNGERHGLRNRDNQKHWTVHMDEFFDHYLLGKPRPEWMDKGVPFLERGKRDVSPLFKKKETTTTTNQASK